MANIKSAAKDARQSVRRREENRARTSQMKKAIKTARTAIGTGDLAAATEAVRLAVKQLDKAAKGKQIHKNKANRNKSKLGIALNTIRFGGAKPKATEQAPA